MTDKTPTLTSPALTGNVVSLNDYRDEETLSDHRDEETLSMHRSFDQLPAAAQRALQEAEARRQAEAEFAKHEAKAAKEIGGRGGEDPARFGDWEIKGRTIDF